MPPNAVNCAPPPATFSRKRAILIGADKYLHVPKLDYCGKDVRDIARAFRESLQFKPEDILEFTTESQQLPKRNDIIHVMGEFLKNVERDELLMFFFSGHGMIDEATKMDYLLPLDASHNDLTDTGLSVDSLVKKLTKSGCQNVVMFIDACREVLDNSKGVKSIGELSQDAIKREGIVTFFSCDPKERSYEIPQIENSSFTHCLMEAIRSGECPTVRDIDRHLRLSVPHVNKKYNKPLQLPFTIIQPAEKADLAIFYSEIKAAPQQQKFSTLLDLLTDLHIDQKLSEKTYNDAVVFIGSVCRSASLRPGEKQKLAFLERLKEGGLCAESFEIVWARLERRARLEQPPKSLN